ncbi:unnamed protein product [Sphagnum jensenii]|uniref:Bifunctional inhibitor/plant lipid transfer protein/seed storage helical domain-containing protein n=1 Tax=Sphagnum jensenii TaxID=128206 RepID=A0ABP1B1G6_9BRYO
MGFVMSSAAGWMCILLLLVAFLGCSTRVRVVATAAAAAGSSNNSSSEDDPAITPATDCSMPETMVVSTSNCSYYDEQNMDGLIGGCRDFLTNIQNLPTKDCCTDVTYVAYTHTPCLCKAIFYPLDSSTVDSSSTSSSSTAVVNATRQKELPGLCLIKINFCTVCLDYLSSSSSQTASSSGSSAKSHKTGITVLKVLLPLVVVGVTIAVAAMLYRTYKARKAATAAAKQQQQQTYVGSVPGGAF